MDGVDFELRRGEVHVLFGENGAGKSTLISLVAGVQTPSDGEIRVEGRVVHFRSVAEARAHGISAVFQEFSLVPTMSVAANLLLGEEPLVRGTIDARGLVRRANELLRQLDFDLDVRRPVSSLTRAEQQMVEIAKAFRGRVSVLILDEPTASLTDNETDHLFALIARIKAQGVGLIYITHRMREIRRIADRITVLRDGRKVGTVDDPAIDERRLIEMMAGRTVDTIYPAIASHPTETLLRLHALSTEHVVRDASLFVRRGEVVGIAGLVGCGKSEVVRAAFGLERIRSGTVEFKGRIVGRPVPGRMLRDGFFYQPPDRKDEGLVLNGSARFNTTLSGLRRPELAGPAGTLSLRAVAALGADIARDVGLTAPPRQLVSQLSGGNQQKVLFGKGFAQPIDLFVFDEPAVGVDVTTRINLYLLIKRLCDEGAGIIVVSSDLPEILHLAHRVYVMRAGEVVAELSGDAIVETEVLRHFFGTAGDAA